MKAVYFSLCIVLGISAGLWWSSSGNGFPQTPSILSDVISKISAPAENPNPPVSINENNQAPISDQSNQAITTLAPTLTTNPHSFHSGIMRVAPSVVSLYARSTQLDNNGFTSQGSGVIVNADGVVLTNLHLVDGLDDITVVLSDGRRHSGILIGSDQETDLAVVKIPANNLPFLRLDEAAPLKVGDIVLAIGNPFGVGQTVTQGIVSATRRRVAGGSAWQNFIQIDAAINPGNSGGALINPQGQLVGVNTAVFRGDKSAIGIGFSIPVELLAQVVPQIIENGSVARGWLGIEVDDLTMFPVISSINVEGAIITNVLESSPANSGGLRPYDVVTHLGEQPIASATQLLLQVSALPPGATVKVTILRSEHTRHLMDPTEQLLFNTLDLKVTLGTRPTINYAR